MDRYYRDGEKITYDEGEIVTERYLRSPPAAKSLVSARDICHRYGIPDIRHNLHRVDEMLDDRLEEAEAGRIKTYRLQRGDQ